MDMPTGPKILVIGFTVWKDKQPYELVGSHVSDEGNSCLIWKATCYDCGAEFTCGTKADEFRGVTRRCDACKAPGRRVERNRYRHRVRACRKAARV